MPVVPLASIDPQDVCKQTKQVKIMANGLFHMPVVPLVNFTHQSEHIYTEGIVLLQQLLLP